MNWDKVVESAAQGAAAGGSALIGAALTAGLLYLSTMKVAKSNLLAGSVTAERAKWRTELRAAIGALHIATLRSLHEPSPERMGEFEAQRVAIRLRLNPSRDPEHLYDIAISDALKELRLAVRRGDALAACSRLETIECNAQRLIKEEWEGSKKEAQTGKIKRRRNTDATRPRRP